MTADRASIQPALAAERALRLAAQCGNRLLSGAVAEVIGDDVVAMTLRGALARMGARPLGQQSGGDAGLADFVFVSGNAGAERIAQLLAARLRDAARLPTTLVSVGELPEPEAVFAALIANVQKPSAPERNGPQAIAGRGGAERWRLRAPRAQIIEFRLGKRSVALAIPAAALPAMDDRSRITESADRLDWALRGMPVTAALATELGESGAIRGTRVGVSLVLEPKTAALALALRDAGAEVAVFAPTGETDQAVAAALAQTGIQVFAPQLKDGDVRESGEPDAAPRLDADTADAAQAAAVLDWAPELLIDDGSHLIRLAHSERPEALESLRAASEETTSGVRPLVEMAAEGELRIPVIAVNDALTKSEFDNRIGTGQSCVFAIADLLDTSAARAAGPDLVDPENSDDAGSSGVAGSHWVIVGYGPVGVGVARFAAALGAHITVVERDAVRALQAVHDGYEAEVLAAALPLADVVVSATGVWHTLDADDLALLRPGAAVAVAGGIDNELALEELRERGWQVDELGPHLASWRAPGTGFGPLVLADGAGVNYTAGEGNPIEVMDLSFATQLASLARIAAGGDSVGVHALDSAAERRVAEAALAAHGASVDQADSAARPGGAAQHWTTHRYRAGTAQ